MDNLSLVQNDTMIPLYGNGNDKTTVEMSFTCYHGRAPTLGRWAHHNSNGCNNISLAHIFPTVVTVISAADMSTTSTELYQIHCPGESPVSGAPIRTPTPM